MTDVSPQSDPTLDAILAAGASGSKVRLAARWVAIGGLILAMGAVFMCVSARDAAQETRYETEPVSRGNLVVTVSATGTLAPTNQVEVGSELSGLIEAVLVDENDRVAKGQVLARLDVSKLNDAITKSKATLASAEAKVEQADATTQETRANLERLRTVSRLSGGKVPSQAELETAEAELARGLADAAAARATVAEARATLSSDETNLEKATIRSPIDGVVLAREVEPGQTMAASFETPVLFTLAEDLSQMELEVDVDEADVGQVREGQSATFQVDAYPARRYPSRITRVGLGSQTTDGVVSYKTILDVGNDDLSLRPGMTATAEITVAARENALLVPSAALRFTPAEEEERPESGGGIVSSLLPKPPAQQTRKSSSARAGGGQRVWILRDGEAVAVDVTAGVSDGRSTEILDGALEPGMPLIIAFRAASE